MWGVRGWLVTIITGAIALGCAAGPLFIPITDPKERLMLHGFSVLPPQGPNWLRGTPEIRRRYGMPENAVDFGKDFTETHTLRAIAYTTAVSIHPAGPEETLRQLVVEVITGSLPTWRFHIVDPLKTTPEFSLRAKCLRYDAIFEDRIVPRLPGRRLLLEMRGVACLHPHGPIGVVAEYSQRRLPEEPRYPLELEGEPFLTSLVFTKFANS